MQNSPSSKFFLTNVLSLPQQMLKTYITKEWVTAFDSIVLFSFSEKKAFLQQGQWNTYDIMNVLNTHHSTQHGYNSKTNEWNYLWHALRGSLWTQQRSSEQLPKSCQTSLVFKSQDIHTHVLHTSQPVGTVRRCMF